MRDRKGLVTNLAVVLGYVVVAFTLLTWVLNAAGVSALPPLISPDEWYFRALQIVLALFAWRVLNRVAAAWRIYGPVHGLLSIPRMVYGNFLNFAATWSAIGRFVRSKISGEVPAWEKTAHAFPSEEQLRRYHHKLGDLLLESRLVTADQLSDALAKQKETGGKLGDILVSDNVLWEEDLVFTLARQQHRDAEEIDPYAVPKNILDRIPERIAREHRVFPLREEDGALVVATDRSDIEGAATELADVIGGMVRAKSCASADMTFALDHGYTEHSDVSLSPEGRLGRRLVADGLIDGEQLKQALRRQKRTGAKLGDALVEMTAVDRERLEKALEEE